jgi:serine/threonine protein kinase
MMSLKVLYSIKFIFNSRVYLYCNLGLKHIHQCGLVHLDIKPANLLIGLSGVIKIGDFGMACKIGTKEDGHEGDSRLVFFQSNIIFL